MSTESLHSAVREARRRWLRHDDPLVAALGRVFEKSLVEKNQKELGWALAGVGLAMAETLAEAREQSGRAIQERIFELHQMSRKGATRGGPVLPRLAHYSAWIEGWLLENSNAKRVFLQWIDVLAERLVMHRYGSAGHRARQARFLVAEPLAIASGLEECETWMQIGEGLLALWDLEHAESQGRVGWNRVEMPDAAQMGGFFGLADEARPPTPEAIRGAAGDLLARCRGLAVRDQTPLEPLAKALRELMISRLRQFLKFGRWPAARWRVGAFWHF